MKLVIFDCDGTLVDSQHVICAAMDAAFIGHGLPTPGRARTLSIVGLSLTEAIAQLAPSESPATVRHLAAAYKMAFMELRVDPAHHEPLYPGIATLLAELAAREAVVLGIATGKSRRGVDRLIETHGLHGRFATIQTADTHPSKPHPSMIVEAMAETGAAAADTVMIGDTTFDMLMAHAAGVATIAVAWGYHPAAELRAAGAHALVEDDGALRTALEGHVGPLGGDVAGSVNLVGRRGGGS